LMNAEDTDPDALGRIGNPPSGWGNQQSVGTEITSFTTAHADG
jgi:hypothetical protein